MAGKIKMIRREELSDWCDAFDLEMEILSIPVDAEPPTSLDSWTINFEVPFDTSVPWWN